MTINLGPEPDGLLLQREDVLTWLPGLTPAQWKKIRPHLQPVTLTGCVKPYYRKSEVRRKVVEPVLRELQNQ
jgi:hypothetical protein